MLPNVSHVPNSLALELRPGMTFTIEPIFVDASVEEIIMNHGLFFVFFFFNGLPVAPPQTCGLLENATCSLSQIWFTI